MTSTSEACSSRTAASLSVTLETLNAGAYGSYHRVVEGSTPTLRKVAGKASAAERQFAFDTACQCTEEAVDSKGPEQQHARYFLTDKFKVLREALQTDRLEYSIQTSLSTSGASLEDDTADSGLTDLQLKDTASSLDTARAKKLGIWTKIKRRLSTESPGKGGPLDSPQRLDKLSPSSMGDGRQGQDEKPFSFVSINVERSLALLIAAAPGRGEVQHWIWLLRSYMEKCSIESAHVMLTYLARVARSIAAEEEWFRLLVLELTPVLEIMRENDLPAGSQVVLRAVADRAMAVSDEAILGFRSHRSSRLENALLLTAAVRLQVLVAKCASGADCTDMGGLFEELLTSAAQRRFRDLLTSHTAGVAAPSGGSADERLLIALGAVCDQLVQDVADDDECYQAAFPSECRMTLPTISCRVYCNLLRTELNGLAGRKDLETHQSFFDLFQGVCQLEQTALRWAPTALGDARSLSVSDGRSVFLPYIEAWMRSIRSKLMQWSMRLLKEEVWQHSAGGTTAGLRCSPSLVELFRALCTITEDNGFVPAAHPTYAALMERTLAKVVLVHVAGLERLCQGEMPSKGGRRLPDHLRSIGSRHETPKGPFRPSSTLCMLLNDLREIRSKQADLGNAVRARLRPEWWGQSAGDGLKEKMRLGDRFKLCQVEIERRYAAVLHHTVKRMMEGMAPEMARLLALQVPEEEPLTIRGAPLMACLDAHLERMAALLDTRVLRRIARELWNALAGVLHEDLVDCQEDQSGGLHHSLGNVGPRIQHVDAALKLLSEHIVAHRFTGLATEDEPEKVAKLRRMLALFMREDEGRSIESL